MIKIAIHSNPFDKNKLIDAKNLIEELLKKNVTVLLSDILAKLLTEHAILEIVHFNIFTQETFPSDTNFMFSLGGDGTLLETILYIKSNQTPILGINSGRLGFLTTIRIADFEKILTLFWQGFYTIESRTLLEVEASKPFFGSNNFALNDFTVLRNETSSMIVVHAYLDGEYLNSYWADGILVSTSTGSTAYSLSVGGPIAMPHSKSFIISPICSHNLNVRPVIVSDDSIIEFQLDDRNKNYTLSLDSRSQKIKKDINIKIKKCHFQAKLLRFSNNNFLDTLRSKLNWGLDIRNYIKK